MEKKARERELHRLVQIWRDCGAYIYYDRNINIERMTEVVEEINRLGYRAIWRVQPCPWISGFQLDVWDGEQLIMIAGTGYSTEEC